MSDGSLSPGQMAKVYKELGYDFLVITDHWSVTKVTLPGLMMYTGQELTGIRHITGMNIRNYVDATARPLEPLLGEINKQNGTAILNHPRLDPKSTVDQVARLNSLHHMEIHNDLVQFGGGFDDQSFWDAVLSSGKKIYGVAGDDAHDLADIGHAWIMVYAHEYERETILSSFNRGRYYASTGVFLDSILVQPGVIRIKSRNADYIRFVGQKGVTLDSVIAKTAEYKITGQEGYIRVVAGRWDEKKAWTQPLVFYNYQQPCLVYLSGDKQQQRVKQPLAAPLVLQTQDMLGNVLTGIPVTFRCIKGNGRFNGSISMDVLSDSKGMVAVKPVLDAEAGDSTHIFSAQVADVQLPLQFTVTALPERPAKIVVLSAADQNIMVQNTLADGLRAAITDEFGNGVAGLPIIHEIVKGDALINGCIRDTVATDAKGQSKVALQMGIHSGEVVVRLSSPSLAGYVTFYRAFAAPSEPVYLLIVSGNEQMGVARTQLAAPYVVAVTDSFGNRIANHPVAFKVIQGGGSFSSNSSATLTNADGVAQAFLILGAEEYNHKASVTSSHNGQPLLNSPVIFNATLKPGPAKAMIKSEGDLQYAVPGLPLSNPLQVQIVDEKRHPVPNHPVIFQAVAPEVYFNNNKDTLHCRTDFNGLAKATPFISSQSAAEKFFFDVSAFTSSGALLANAPMRFTALLNVKTIKTLAPVSARTLSGVVHSQLLDSLIVRILDSENNPVSGYPVKFKAIKGKLWINQEPDSITVFTRNDGLVAAGLTLPDKAGQMQIRAAAEYRATALEGSPCDFTVTVLAGPVSSDKSQFSADSLVIADGRSECKITVRVLDTWRNPIPDALVDLTVSGIPVNLKAARINTDSSGLAQTTLTSMKTGKAKISATVNGKPITNSDRIVLFVAGPAQQIVVINGSQKAQYNTLLPDSVGVLVRDALGNPTPDVEIRFITLPGAGLVRPGNTGKTNQEGFAFRQWQLGDIIGEQKISVQVPGLNETFYITALAQPIPAAKIQIISGDRQIGLINQVLHDSLIAEVIDGSGKPARGHDVYFNLEGNGPILETRLVRTNANGRAAVMVTCGPVPGAFRVWAHVSGVADSIAFQFHIQANPSITLTEPSIVAPTARPGQTVSVEFRVLDIFARPLANERIICTDVREAGQPPAHQIMISDEQGWVRYKWVLGAFGKQRLLAYAEFKAGNPLSWEIQIVNTAPKISAPTILEGTTNDSLSFSVQATDAEQDSFFVTALQLPAGAIFTSDHQFKWLPRRHQQGAHVLTFAAYDAFGAADTAFVSVLIQHLNHTPEILSFAPAESLLHIPYFQRVDFTVQVVDSDEDSLQYQWKWNGQFLGDLNTMSIIATPLFPMENEITVTISDGQSQSQKTWRMMLKPPSAVHDLMLENNQIPVDWDLAQNYPNPFNSVTRITFALPQADHVQIKILDLTGKEQATIVDRLIPAGRHQMTWDAGHCTSGVYILSMQSSGKRFTRKMVLVR